MMMLNLTKNPLCIAITYLDLAVLRRLQAARMLVGIPSRFPLPSLKEDLDKYLVCRLNWYSPNELSAKEHLPFSPHGI